MATQTKTVSGTTVTYVITDWKGNTVTVVGTTGGNGVLPTSGMTITTSAAIQPDAQAMLFMLILLLSTGLQP